MAAGNAGKGKGHATLWTCDLTGDYVQINANYRTWLGYFPAQKCRIRARDHLLTRVAPKRPLLARDLIRNRDREGAAPGKTETCETLINALRHRGGDLPCQCSHA